MAKTIIYDLGANNGDDTAYYLRKADLVVAVEAIPGLCDLIGNRFAADVAAGRLKVENAVLTVDPRQTTATFHIHKTNDVLSQFPPPDPDKAAEFAAVTRPALSVTELFARHGQPHYVKIDLEHYDAEVLRALFANRIFPDYVSAEAHHLDVFRLLADSGVYNAFKLVDGRSVAERYGEHFIMTPFGRELHQFPFHAAGPYGNDIPGNWMTADDILALLKIVGTGWKDIHASLVDAPSPGIPPWLLPGRQ